MFQTQDTASPLPDQVMWDFPSGYAVNMPLGPQDYPGWQKDKPEAVERIMNLRRQANITVPDDQWSEKIDSAPKTPTVRASAKKPRKPVARTRGRK